MYEIILAGESFIYLAFHLVFCNLVDIVRLIEWHILWTFVDKMFDYDLMMGKLTFINKSPILL